MSKSKYEINARMRCRGGRARSWYHVGLLLALCTTASAQTAPLALRGVPVSVDSGVGSNSAAEISAVYTTTARIPDASWMQIKLDKVELTGNVRQDNASYLRFTSVLDAGVQTSNAAQVTEWRNSSAHFNGDAVQSELITHPPAGGNCVMVCKVVAGVPSSDWECVCMTKVMSC